MVVCSQFTEVTRAIQYSIQYSAPWLMLCNIAIIISVFITTIIIITMVQSPWHVTARVQPIHLINAQPYLYWLANLRPSQLTGQESIYRLLSPTSIIAICYFTQCESWYTFYHPIQGRRLSDSVQLMPNNKLSNCNNNLIHKAPFGCNFRGAAYP